MSRVFFVFVFNQKGENDLIINIVSRGREELAFCPNAFVWDCGYGFTQRNQNCVRIYKQ